MPERVTRDFEKVLDAEIAQVHTRRSNAFHSEPQAPPPPANGETNKRPPLVGIALSGGGIRSACVNMGLLQSLYRNHILRYVDYMSTVSGGGYLGAMLSSYLSKEESKVEWNNPVSGPTGPDRKRLAICDHGGKDSAPLVKHMAHRGQILNNPIRFLSHHLFGIIAINAFLLSAIVAVCSLAAYAYRLIDHKSVTPWISEFVAIGDIPRALLPATVLFLVWCMYFLYQKYQSQGTQAKLSSTGRSSKLYLVFIIVCIMSAVGALTIGQYDTSELDLRRMHLPENVEDSATKAVENLSDKSVYILLAGLAVAMAPYLSLRSLLRSGAAPKSKLQSTIFNIAAHALLLGIPIFVYGIIVRENFSGYRQNRDFPSDFCHNHFINWYPFWQDVTSLKWQRELYLGEIDSKDRLSARVATQIFKEVPISDDIGPHSSASNMAQFNEAWNRHTKRNDSFDSNVFPRTMADQRQNPPSGIAKELVQMATAAEKVAAEKVAYEFLDHMRTEYLDSVRTATTEQAQRDRDEFKIARFAASRIRDRIALRERKAFITEVINVHVLSHPNSFVKELEDVGKLRSSLLLSDKEPSDQQADLLRRSRAWLAELQQLQRMIEQECGITNALCPNPRLELRKAAEKFASLESERTKNVPAKDSRAQLEESRAKVERLLHLTQKVQKTNGEIIRYCFNAPDRTLILGEDSVFSYIVNGEDQRKRLELFGWSLFVFILIGVAVPVNWTHLHGFYRDQLGELWIYSRQSQVSDIPMMGLKNCDKGGPFHLINCTVPLLGRKGDSGRDGTVRFTISPLHVGGERVGYARTESYMNGQLGLADAMALSGAAISPFGFENVLVRALVTVFNLRLGQWLDRPTYVGGFALPQTFLGVVISRLFVPAEERPRLFVCDGGHSDNTGVGALLQRRCRVIIASDATQDEGHVCPDLRRLLLEGSEKYGVRFLHPEWDAPPNLDDFLAPVPKRDTDGRLMENHHDLWANSHYVVIRIVYPDDEFTRRATLDSGNTGWLIYIKASLTGDESSEMLLHRKSYPDFPNDPTADAFFEPTRFMLYRQLGEHMGDEVCRKLFNGYTHCKPPEELYRFGYEWHPPDTQNGNAATAKLDVPSDTTISESFIEVLEKVVGTCTEEQFDLYCVYIREYESSLSPGLRTRITSALLSRLSLLQDHEHLRCVICETVSLVGRRDPQASRVITELSIHDSSELVRRTCSILGSRLRHTAQ